MPTAYIGIGSNLGSREDNCTAAIKHLIDSGIKVLKLSSRIETEPWGLRDQPNFINMAIMIQTGLTPEDLLKLLKKIEIELGRAPGLRWGPRIIDLDILLYDDLVFETPDLKIPHPGTSDRYFVLRPLAEIAPDTIHPVLKKSIRALLDSL
ncbi:MAG: 2-amino-4-hydroxy-6-hydroxymethyldihydropteridine diphosphokinase [Nitrospirae bacterium]|nr:2-amino-4-hydroxy-6-hydroxymethyldihydropteridine diphosphokinase [Nitrospirota bacterium]